MLWHAMLVDTIHSGMFEITMPGKLYLSGELDAAHLPTPTVDRVLRG